MVLGNAALSALLNLLLLAGFPFLFYFVYHKWRCKRGFKEIARRAGLQVGERRYIGYSLVFALVTVAVLVIRPLPLDSLVREGSAWRSFVGLGFGMPAVVMSLLYGVVKTGFAEELLFRGLIAGSLSRRLPVIWANLVQAVIFLVPHLFVLFIMPEMWGILPVIFVGSLFFGWVRIKSDSIMGPWLIHACANTAMGLSVAIRSA
jgi:membrane protease YdiL (CAAX protease family)